MSDVELAEIADHLELAPLLGAWHVAEWSELYRGWTADVATEEFRAMDVAGRIPTTWVAFDGPGRTAADVVGSVSLLADDDLDGFRHLDPWLASLYVVPAARGRGIGRRLVACAIDAARRLGVARLHLFTAGQEDWYRALGWRTVARPVVHGHDAAVMVYDTDSRAPRAALVSRWCRDADFGTAYGYLRPGGEPADREVLARPLAPGLYLAGEATWSAHPGTLHGAWWSGERAARQVLSDAGARSPDDADADVDVDVIVVGAGLAGLAAARALHRAGRSVLVAEAGVEAGGRMRVDRSLGGPVHTGASWLHGEVGNPVAELADRLGVPHEPVTWGQSPTYLIGHGRLDDDELERLGAAYAGVERAVEACARVAPPALALGPLGRALVGAAATSERDAVVLGTWLRGEYQGLYAAPLDDLSLAHCAEPYRLAGSDRLVTGPLDRVARSLADSLDVRYGARVTEVRAEPPARWRVATAPGSEPASSAGSSSSSSWTSAAVVVTVAVGVLQAGGIRFDPPLPAGHRQALGRIGAGRVAKVFLAFDRRFWPPERTFWVAGDPPAPVELWVDVSGLAGRPTLCGFATGASAGVVEALTEDELCDLGRSVLGVARVFDAEG